MKPEVCRRCGGRIVAETWTATTQLPPGFYGICHLVETVCENGDEELYL